MRTLFKKSVLFVLVAFMVIGVYAFGIIHGEQQLSSPQSTSSVVWFPTDRDGNIDRENPLETEPSCSGGEDYCSVSFNENDLTPEGYAPIQHAENDPNSLIVDTKMQPEL